MSSVTPAPDRPHRKRIRLDPAFYRGGVQAFLVTICVVDRRPWFSQHPALADYAATEVAALAANRGAILHAWCVMPDHLHLLIADVDVVDFIRILKGRVAVHARRADAGRRFWQRSFHDHAPRSGEDLYCMARYVLENPVRAGIVTTASEYRWAGSGTWVDWREW